MDTIFTLEFDRKKYHEDLKEITPMTNLFIYLFFISLIYWNCLVYKICIIVSTHPHFN